MRVKLCNRCPYSPPDLADYYDANSSCQLCFRCDGKSAPAELAILVTASVASKCARAEYILNAERREDGKYILIPSQKIERNRDNPDGRNHLCAPPLALSQTDNGHCVALGGAT
jgi:hypothetical protein